MKNQFCLMLCCWMMVCSLMACMNSVEEDEMLHPGTVPISFSGKVNKISQTRVSDKALEPGDELGLMAVLSGGSLSGPRYIDNVLLRASEGTALLPDELLYYPEGEGTYLDFVAYHPYSLPGMAQGSSRIKVKVEGDQRVKKNRSLSDFLVAVKKKVGASRESVSLSFKHKLAKVKVELVLKSEKEADVLLAADPELRACGFMTEAQYDFATDVFSDASAPEMVFLSGSWKKSGTKLVGKEMIVVPQAVQQEQQFLTLEVRGKLYTCRLSASSLGSNSQRIISVAFHEAVDSELAGLVGEVQDWSDGALMEEKSESVYALTQVQTGVLGCVQSNIYHICYQGRLLAELCKEYLRLPDAGIDSPAWVLYPAHEGVVSLSEGTVLELLDESGPVHGGKITWNQEDNTAVYVPGTSAPVRSFFLNESGKVALTRPEKPLAVQVKAYELKDVRGDEVKRYGLVKIGTQYWMRESLKADGYTDGKQLPLKQMMSAEACRLVSEKGDVFYNREAVNGGKMAPQGWKIPERTEWMKLVDYVGSAAALKAGTWALLSSTPGELAPVTNRAMFMGYPAGMWMNQLSGSASVLFLWTLNEGGLQAAEQGFCLAAHQEQAQWINVTNPNTKLSKGLSIRLLRK